jgi:all-trans-8'-apo-beta-carotenal 15,15'-oxygenase
VDPFYQWHFANAFEAGRELVVDFVRFGDFRTNAWLSDVMRGVPDDAPHGRLSRARVDVGARRFACETLFDVPCEFPRIAEARVGRAHRYTYAAGYTSHASARGLHDAVLRLDVGAAPSLARWALPEGSYTSEAVFVADPRRAASGAEDDGWLLSLVYDGIDDRSHVAVLDARRLEEGPIARVWFDDRIPFTFHGAFVPGGIAAS